MDIVTSILYVVALIAISVICVVFFIKFINLKDAFSKLNNEYTKSKFQVARLQEFVKLVDNCDEMRLRADHPNDIRHANLTRKQFRDLLDYSGICIMQPSLKLALNNTSKITTMED